jgi:uncharacterized membrane protein YphA (DoxX/SURF4 family)
MEPYDIELGLVFIFAALWPPSKVGDPAGFAQSIYNYRMVPEVLLNLMGVLMPWLELVAGILIITGPLVRGSAFMIGFMLLVFIIAISAALFRGLDISCGCFSTGGGHGVAVDLLIRDVLMFIGAAIVVLKGGEYRMFCRPAD